MKVVAREVEVALEPADKRRRVEEPAPAGVRRPGGGGGVARRGRRRRVQADAAAVYRLFQACHKVFRGPGTVPKPDEVHLLRAMLGPTDEEEVPRLKPVEDSVPPIKIEWEDAEDKRQGIVLNKQKELEERDALVANLKETTRMLNRIYRQSMAKSETLEKLVPHINYLENIQHNLKQTKEEAEAKEIVLRTEIMKLHDANWELRNSVRNNISEIEALKAQLKKAETDNAKLESDKNKALEEIEVFAEKVRRAEKVRDDIANATTPILTTIYDGGVGPSDIDTVEIFDKLRTAPEKYIENITDAAVMSAGQALAMTKSLYPRVDINSVADGFADGTSIERAMELINEAQESAKRIGADIADSFKS